MNERGLAVSVNMIQDSEDINQDTAKPDITTTTAIRLLLDKAADVEEALKLLRMHPMKRWRSLYRGIIFQEQTMVTERLAVR